MAQEVPDDIATAPKAFTGFARRINALLKLGRALVAMEGKNGIKVELSDGNILITFDPRAAGVALAGDSDEHPFQVLNASVTTPSPGAKVSVVFGQVNSVTPTIGTDFLGSLIGDPPAPPALTVVSGPVFLEVTVDASGLVTGVEVKNATSLPANTSTKGHITLAMVTVASNAVTAINQSVTHSLSHYKCGTTVHRFVAV